jgi:hypothetical protein
MKEKVAKKLPMDIWQLKVASQKKRVLLSGKIFVI